MQECVFCQIVEGKSSAHIVWQDTNHLAFLSIFPNTEGVTVVVPKKHYSSYIFDVPEEIMTELVICARKVAKKIDKTFDDVARTALIFEGFGVDHLHAKLFPMHGTKSEKWQKKSSQVTKYFENYEGYISSHDSIRANDKDLEKTAEKIRNTK